MLNSSLPANVSERFVAPRITLSQARTLAAFDSLAAYLSEVNDPDIGRMLRATFGYDDATRTGIHHVDVTIDGVAYVQTDNGVITYSRETMRAHLRDAMGAGR